MSSVSEYLRSEIIGCLNGARYNIRRNDTIAADYSLSVALAFARQMPDNPKWRACRAYIAQAREALANDRSRSTF